MTFPSRCHRSSWWLEHRWKHGIQINGTQELNFDYQAYQIHSRSDKDEANSYALIADLCFSPFYQRNATLPMTHRNYFVYIYQVRRMCFQTAFFFYDYSNVWLPFGDFSKQMGEITFRYEKYQDLFFNFFFFVWKRVRNRAPFTYTYNSHRIYFAVMKNVHFWVKTEQRNLTELEIRQEQKFLHLTATACDV